MFTVVCLLAAYGLAFAWQHKLPPNFLPSIRQCNYCAGFWAGCLTWGLSWLITGQPVIGPALANDSFYCTPYVGGAVLWAFSTAAFCYALDTLVAYWETAHGPSDRMPG